MGGDRFFWARGPTLGSANISPGLCFGVSFFPMILTFFIMLPGSRFQPFLDVFHQGPANYTPWAKSSPAPIFVLRSFIGTSHAHLFAYCLWLFCATMTELSSYDGDCVSTKSKIFTTWPFVKSFPTPVLDDKLPCQPTVLSYVVSV